MSESKFDLPSLIRYMREKKSLWLALAALLIGVVLILFGGSDASRAVSASLDSSVDPQSGEYEQRLEARVKELLERVSGVSDVTVMVTLDSLSEQVYAQNYRSSESDSSTDIDLEYVNGQNGLVPTKELSPSVRGIAVVCRGGDDAEVALKLTRLLSSLFGIPSSSVSVTGAKET